MNKTTSTLTLAAACLILGGTAQAQLGARETIVERRITTVPVEEQTVLVQPKTRVLSGETLAGRREVIADDAAIIQDGGRQRALIRKGNAIKTPRINRFLGPGEMADDEVEIELEVAD